MEEAVVDRIEEGIAVLLVGRDEREVSVPVTALPAGTQSGVVLRVTLVNGNLVEAKVDAQATKDRRKRVQAKLDRLLGRDG